MCLLIPSIYIISDTNLDYVLVSIWKTPSNCNPSLITFYPKSEKELYNTRIQKDIPLVIEAILYTRIWFDQKWLHFFETILHFEFYSSSTILWLNKGK